jgi:hypothetical protein
VSALIAFILLAKNWLENYLMPIVLFLGMYFACFDFLSTSYFLTYNFWALTHLTACTTRDICIQLETAVMQVAICFDLVVFNVMLIVEICL